MQESFGLTFYYPAFTSTIWGGCLKVIKRLQRKFPQLEQTKRRILFEFIFSMVTMAVITSILDIVFHFIFKDEGRPLFMVDNYLIGGVATAFVLSVYEGLYFFEKYQEALVTTEELKKSNLQSQFDSLKNQVNPHFLFNSLNTLASLIEEDKNASIKFVQKMSTVYRYLLQSNEKELTTIGKELEFIQSYIFMLKTRFDESLKVEIQIADEYKDYLVTPLTLQLLVENAVKHNVVSNENPLVIKIFVDDEQKLVVSNVLQRKTHLVKSNGVGLKNIMQRYELLGKRKVEVIVTEKRFEVKVPLMEQQLKGDKKFTQSHQGSEIYIILNGSAPLHPNKNQY
ncbi:MAG: histidine kinase [Bacteroidetes bacterium]|nr:histidine kinase [Bacteroidota bacterium]